MTTIGSHIDWFNATIVNRTYFRLAGNDQFNVTKAITSLDLPLTTRNISNITETIFTKSNFVPSPPDQYKKYQLNFTLFAKYSLPPMEFWTVPVTKDVEVYACLPYRTTAAAPDIFPYTDTLSGDDPFLANHSCCHDGTTGSPYGTIFGIGENQVCFNESEFGPFFAFDLNKYKKPQPFGLTAISIPYSSTQTFSMPADINRPEANDIFTRTFNRYCDGKRGNICNGSMTDDFEITPANQCFDGETWQEERCVGPHQDYFNSVPGGDLSTPTTCALYTGDTFEKRAVNAGLTADPAITGYCGRGACTSAPGATYGDVEFDIDPSRSDKGVACKAGCNAGVCTLDVSTCVCDNTFCSASSAACNNLPPNTIYPSPPEDPKSGQYCDGECGLVSCPNNYAVINTGPSLSCYTACDHANNGAGGQNDACKTGFTCDADVTSASLNTCI